MTKAELVQALYPFHDNADVKITVTNGEGGGTDTDIHSVGEDEGPDGNGRIYLYTEGDF